MAIDAHLLHCLEPSSSLLHFYQWKHECPVTYGYFVNPQDVFTTEALSCLDHAKRPTGGGVVFHNGDFAFSLLVSFSHPLFSQRVLDNYQTVNTLVVRSLERAFGISGELFVEDKEEEKNNINFCMAKISRYDVLFQGRKIGGAAQRTTTKGFLHQGSVFLSGRGKSFYQPFLKEEVLDNILDKTQKNSFYLLGDNNEQSSLLEDARRTLQESFVYEYCHWSSF